MSDNLGSGGIELLDSKVDRPSADDCPVDAKGLASHGQVLAWLVRGCVTAVASVPTAGEIAIATAARVTTQRGTAGG